MDSERRIRLLFVFANLGWTVLVLAISAGAAVGVFYAVDAGSSLTWVVLGALSGAALGGIHDVKVFQAMLGAAGLLLLGFTLFWAQAGGTPAPVSPILGGALVAWGTSVALVRIWGRELHIEEPTVTEIDEFMARPRVE